jgi:hypothetical protein
MVNRSVNVASTHEQDGRAASRRSNRFPQNHQRGSAVVTGDPTERSRGRVVEKA